MKTSKEKVEKYIEMARSIALNTVDLNSSDIVEIAKMIQKEELENKPNPLVVYKPEHGNLGTNKTSPFGEHICESGGSTYLSCPPKYKCKICGKFYYGTDIGGKQLPYTNTPIGD